MHREGLAFCQQGWVAPLVQNEPQDSASGNVASFSKVRASLHTAPSVLSKTGGQGWAVLYSLGLWVSLIIPSAHHPLC